MKRPTEVIELSDSEDEAPKAKPSKRSKPAPARAQEPPADDDTFDDEMRRAMALSLADSTASGSGASTSKKATGGASQAGTGSRGASGGSREEMERERIARQAAREAGGGPAAPPTKLWAGHARPKVATISDIAAGASSSASTSAVASSSSSSVHGFASSSAAAAGPRPSERFWQGSIKRVANTYVPDSDSFTFKQVLGPIDELESAIVSSYVLDIDWVISHFPKELPLMLVKPGSKGGAPEVLVGDGRTKTFKVAPHAYEMHGWTGSMHTKAIVLCYKKFMRVVIPSANMIDFDWERIDNVLYIQDFPLRAPSTSDVGTTPANNPTHTRFSKDFLKALKKLAVPPKFLVPFRDFDFSKSDEVQLVVSNQGKEWYQWDGMNDGGGIVSLANSVKALGFSAGGVWQIEATGSSIGQYSDNWLAQFYSACKGSHPEEWLTSKNKTEPGLAPGKRLPIKIVYPTLAEVDASRGGRPGGGTLFFPEKRWKDKNFPKNLLHQGRSKRKGVIAHTKTIIAIHRPDATSPPGSKSEGYIYVGSHNFTPSAWGTLMYTTSGPGITIPNYEMGVIVPLKGDTIAEIEKDATERASFQRPLHPYGPDDVPWQQEVYK
ncbi:hypothetical protein RQP46_007789 [Phenoliferia psychrophenolica]